jgi:hypothetical protein
MRSHVAQTVRNIVGGFLFGLAAVRRTMAETLTEIAIGYPESPINGPHAAGVAGPAPGERVRPMAGQTQVGGDSAPRFALCAAASEAVQQLCARHPGMLESTPRPPLAEHAVHLIRPDGYVACALAPGDEQKIDAYLNGLRGKTSA